MRLRCSNCRKAWIDAQVGVCPACGLTLGKPQAPPQANPNASGAFDIDLAEDLNADFARVSTPPPAPGEDEGPGWRPTSITGVTGEDAIKHHGIPERVAGATVALGTLRPFESYLLGVINGASYVDDVVRASGLGPHEAAVALQSLKEKGLIRFKSVTPSKAVPAPIDGLVEEPSFGNPVSDSSLPVAQGVPLALRDEDPDEQVALAVAAREAGDLVRAREHARLAWLTKPEHRQAAVLLDALENPRHAKTRARLLHDMGNKAHLANDFARAVALYRGALAEFEPSAVIHHKLAMVLVLAGISYEEAEQHLLRAIQLQPNHVVYGNNLARLREMKAAAGLG